MKLDKKIIVRILFVVFCYIILAGISCNIVNALDLSDYPDMFIQDNTFNAFIVVGNSPSAEDVVGANGIINSLKEEFEGINIGDIKLASQITDSDVHNLILIGMPFKDTVSGNPIIDQFYSDKPSGSLIKLIQNQDKYVLIITGDTTQNIKEAANILINHKEYNLDGTKYGNDKEREEEKDAGGSLLSYDIKDRMKKWTSKSYNINGLEYKISLPYFDSYQDPSYVKFEVNGKETKPLENGDIYEFDNGEKIQVIGIFSYEAEFLFKAREKNECSDSDGGRRYYEHGVLIFTKGEDKKTFEDYCDGDKVYDYYCDKDNNYALDWTYCPNGCRNGTCIEIKEKKHLLVAEDKAPSSDVITLTDIGNYLISYGYKNIEPAKLNSEVTKDMLDYRVTTFVYKEDAVIIIGENSPQKHRGMAQRISSFLEKEKGIKAVMLSSSEVKHDDLMKLLPKKEEDAIEGTVQKQDTGKSKKPDMLDTPKTNTQANKRDQYSSNAESNDINQSTTDKSKTDNLIRRLINWLKNLFI